MLLRAGALSFVQRHKCNQCVTILPDNVMGDPSGNGNDVDETIFLNTMCSTQQQKTEIKNSCHKWRNIDRTSF